MNAGCERASRTLATVTRRLDPRTRARVRLGLRIAVVVILVWVLATGVLIFLARQRVNSGLDTLQQARDRLSATQLLTGQGQASLQAAEQEFASAHRVTSNPILAPWTILPLLGSNVSSVRSLTTSAEQVARVGVTAARRGHAAVSTPAGSGDQRLALLNHVADLTAQAQRDLKNVDLGSKFLLIGPVSAARKRFQSRLDNLRTAITDAHSLALGAIELLRGPRRYLVLAANNGEMRAGSGMFLAAGVATFANGTFTMGPMVPTPTIDLPAGAVPLTGSLAANWAWLAPSQHWRSLATSPRFDETAPLAAQMWQAETGQHVDGVLAVDPVALQALLLAQGPIQVGDQQLSGKDVAGYLLLDQYKGIPADVGDQQGRLDQLSNVARSAVDALATRPWQATPLIAQLTNVGKGRHVLAWATDPVEQRAWVAAGIAGQFHTDSLALSVMNFGGNKLDQFLNVDSSISVHSGSGGTTAVHVDVALHNVAPTDLSGYVAGPNPGIGGVGEGVYQGILAFNVPGVASLPTLQGVAPEIAATSRWLEARPSTPASISCSRRDSTQCRCPPPPGFRRSPGTLTTRPTATQPLNAWRGSPLALWLRSVVLFSLGTSAGAGAFLGYGAIAGGQDEFSSVSLV
jgi:hypothetical protein